MTLPPPRASRRSFPRPPLLLGLALLAAPLASAAPAADPGVSGAPAAAAEAATVQLNPFEVTADSDDSYGAVNDNSLTAFNTALSRLPVTADIFDQAFMSDVGAINVEDAIQSYDAGSQFGSIVASNAAENQPGDHVANGSLRLRGAPIGGMQINGLLIAGGLGNPGGTSFGSTSNFYLERIAVVNGPQSLLYAGGGPGGVIDLETKEARLGSPTFGSFAYRVDQYGSKYATLDYGASAGPVAVRVALVDGTLDSRRVNIGDQLEGGYVQLAASLGQTIVRFSLQQSVDSRVDESYQTITSSSADPLFAYNGDHLEYLLAAGLAGGIDNGNLNWDNVESLEGERSEDNEVAEWASLQLESKWTNWLSTELSIAAGDFNDDQAGGAPGGASTVNFYTPGASSNPLPGNWTLGMPQSGFAAADEWRPHVNRAIRFSAVASNDLFDGRAHSQTNFVVDYTGNYNAITPYAYYLADSNFNVVVNAASSANGGRTLLPTQAWTVNNGPVMYSLFNPQPARLTLNGINYVRAQETPLVNTNNGDFSAGEALVNYTQWLDGKLDTLVGLRLSHQKDWTGIQAPSEVRNAPDFSAGADYHLLPWLAP